MTEHVHEWRWADDRFVPYFCRVEGCEETLSIETAEARLNATERLSAELQVWLENTDAKHGIHIDNEILTEWIDILEGKDE